MVLVEQPLLQHTCGLLISLAEFNRGNPSSIPREGRIFISLSTFVKRPMMGERRPSFGIFVVWSASFVSAESLERGGIISSRSFYGQLPDYYSHVFSLIHPVDEFSFKEMRTWGQSKISSCFLCVLCKSGEIWSRVVQYHQWWRGSPQTFQLQKVIGQSRIQNYLTTEFLCESIWSAFR